ncbi:MAG: TlpA family protein disulfide reductase [Anaerolineales bacterium]
MEDASTKNASPRGVPLWAQVMIWSGLLGLLVILGIGLMRTQQGSIQRGDRVPPNLTLTLYQGYEYNGQSQVSFQELRGKVVLVNFWASWCKPCEQEAAELQQVWEYYQPSGEVLFLGVDYVDTEPDARIYLKKFKITYPNGPDLGTRLAQRFRIKGVPETYILDREGVVRYVKIGPFRSGEEIRSVIDQILAKP